MAENQAPQVRQSQGQYFTLPELCRLQDDTSPKCLDYLKDHPSSLTDVTQHLAQIGLKRFTYHGSGAHGIVLDTVDGQLVRLSFDKHEMPIPAHPAILQPIRSDVLESESPIRIQIFPKVERYHSRTHRHLAGDVEDLYFALNESGLVAHDFFENGNVGVLPSGKPIAIDAGNFTYSPDIPFTPAPPGVVAGGWVDEAGCWQQHKDFPAIKSGELTGTLGAKQLEALEASRGPQSVIVQACKDGYYAPEIGQLLADAETKRPAGETFREAVERERRQKAQSRSGPDSGKGRHGN